MPPGRSDGAAGRNRTSRHAAPPTRRTSSTIENLYLMLAVGFAAYLLTIMKYPIAPLVIGVILGPMADQNLRRALMVGQGDPSGFVTRPVSLILVLAIVLLVISQVPALRRGLGRLVPRRRRAEPGSPPRSIT